MNTLQNRLVHLTLLFVLFSCLAPAPESTTIDLSGSWLFKMDPEDRGISEEWQLKTFEEQVLLPGSMAENGKGHDISVETEWTGGIVDRSWFTEPRYEPYRQPGNIKVPFWLQPDKHYQGAAWYQKEVFIPKIWRDKNLVLKLERCHWETRLWIDDQEIGMRNSLGTPQYYQIPGNTLNTGNHTITIRVDNRIKDINPGVNAHSISDHTQSNWNGIAGAMSITAHPAVYIEETRIFTDPSAQLVKALFRIYNGTGKDIQTEWELQAVPLNNAQVNPPPSMQFSIAVPAGSYEYEAIYPMGSEIMLWDEFYPNLYSMESQFEDCRIRIQASDHIWHKRIQYQRHRIYG